VVVGDERVIVETSVANGGVGSIKRAKKKDVKDLSRPKLLT